MIIAAFTIQMTAVQNASLPVSHGRLLHAALLDLVRIHDSDLAERMHNANTKPFSLSTLTIPQAPITAGKIKLAQAATAQWQINSLDTDLTNLLLAIRTPTIIRIGQAHMEIHSITLRTDPNGNPAIIDTEALVERTAHLAQARSFTINIHTPISFRYYETDYPLPRPDLIFGSLTERWNQINDTITLDSDLIKTIVTQHLIPIKWEGKTKRINITPQHGTTGFIGTFTYSMKTLPEQHRRILIILLEFARYSGIGRLTAQGLGTINISYN